ncbi:MAG: hypothetical protein NW206_19715 [Hyphomonadaceae bacterium]|nr:hypothetical protein [Hyphomonadaceae bacterium]
MAVEISERTRELLDSYADWCDLPTEFHAMRERELDVTFGPRERFASPCGHVVFTLRVARALPGAPYAEHEDGPLACDVCGDGIKLTYRRGYLWAHA